MLVVLGAYAVVYVLRPRHWGPLDAVDLAIHETGHLVFAPFGEIMGFLGGTLFQLIVPLAFVAYFLGRSDRFAAMVTLWWVGQNLLNIAVYVRDARSQVLPLVGGGVHDWTYLLGTVGWLHHDQSIANGVHLLGVLTVVGSLYGAASWLDPTDRSAPRPTGWVEGESGSRRRGRGVAP